MRYKAGNTVHYLLKPWAILLWEHENKGGKMFGFTENYVRVSKDFDAASVNQIEVLRLENILPDGTVSVQSSFESFLANA